MAPPEALSDGARVGRNRRRRRRARRSRGRRRDPSGRGRRAGAGRRAWRVAEVRGQPCDEGVLDAIEGDLGASGGTRKYGGRRQAGDVDVARRRRDRERERYVAACTAEICGLIERGEILVQTRDE